MRTKILSGGFGLAMILGAVGGGLALDTGVASATHTHVLHTGNGDCVVLAANGGETDVKLPQAVFDHNPNVTTGSGDPTRTHPLHVLVHKGSPGTHNTIEVLGPDDTCDGFVNAD